MHKPLSKSCVFYSVFNDTDLKKKGVKFMPENQVFGRAGGGVDIRVAEWHNHHRYKNGD